MNIDYSYGNQFYQYFGNTGIKSVEYQLMAPEQEQKDQPGMEYLMTPRPTFVFLASDDSSYVTGQVIYNNGGQVME